MTDLVDNIRVGVRGLICLNKVMDKAVSELSVDCGSHLTAELPPKQVLVKLLWVSGGNLKGAELAGEGTDRVRVGGALGVLIQVFGRGVSPFPIFEGAAMVLRAVVKNWRHSTRINWFYGASLSNLNILNFLTRNVITGLVLLACFIPARSARV